MDFPLTIEAFRALRFKVVAFGDTAGEHWNRMVCAIDGLTKYNSYTIRNGEFGKKRTHYYYNGRVYFDKPNQIRELINRINGHNGTN